MIWFLHADACTFSNLIPDKLYWVGKTVIRALSLIEKINYLVMKKKLYTEVTVCSFYDPRNMQFF